MYNQLLQALMFQINDIFTALHNGFKLIVLHVGPFLYMSFIVVRRL